MAQDDDLKLLELTRAQPPSRDRQHTSKQQVQQRYDQVAASLQPNPKTPTLRSRTSSDATSGGPDGITYATPGAEVLTARARCQR
jgi:hypothetical protein